MSLRRLAVAAGKNALLLSPTFWVLALLLLGCSSTVLAQVQDENTVKAAFVYNLTKYVQWPDPGGELVIGFLGQGPLGEILKRSLGGKSTDGRPIRVLMAPPDEELEHCNLLYIEPSSRKSLRPLLEKLAGKPILTVSDQDFFTEEGGVIGLVRSGLQIHIEVNQDAARASHLTISSRLLSLSRIVKSAPGGKG